MARVQECKRSKENKPREYEAIGLEETNTFERIFKQQKDKDRQSEKG